MRASAHEICYVCAGRYPVIVCKPIVIAFALHARRPGCKPGASDAALVHAHDELPTRRAQPVPETSASARGRTVGCEAICGSRGVLVSPRLRGASAFFSLSPFILMGRFLLKSSRLSV